MTNSILDRISIASPCTADWAQMQGDAKSRFCAQCKLHVHDLSAMTAAEADAKLRSAGQGRLCVRFFRRADGTVLTQDCPVGWKRRVRRAWARAAALAVALLGSLTGCTRRAVDVLVPGATPPRTTGPEAGGLRVMGESNQPGRVEMGDSLAPTPPPRPTMGLVAPEPVPTSQPQPPQKLPK